MICARLSSVPAYAWLCISLTTLTNPGMILPCNKQPTMDSHGLKVVRTDSSIHNMGVSCFRGTPPRITMEHRGARLPIQKQIPQPYICSNPKLRSEFLTPAVYLGFFLEAAPLQLPSFKRNCQGKNKRNQRPFSEARPVASKSRPAGSCVGSLVQGHPEPREAREDAVGDPHLGAAPGPRPRAKPALSRGATSHAPELSERRPQENPRSAA